MKHSSNSSNGDENKNKSASNKWTTSSEEELADCVRRIFNKFDFDSVGVMNLETALALESEVLDALTEISKQSRRGYRVDPRVHVKLANCFRAVDNPDACDKAVSYYRKAIDHEVKLVDDYEAYIIRCYLDFDRCDEAMETFKEFYCSHVENDTAIDPEFIMSIARRFESKGEFGHKLRLQKLLSSFDLTVRSEALCEYRMAIDGYKSALSVSRDQNDKSAEAHALEALGRVYAKIHKNHTAMNRLQKALTIRMQLKAKVSIPQMIGIYIQMGYVHLNHGAGGREKNALEVFEMALRSYRLALPIDEKCPFTAKDAARLVSIYNGMGLTYYNLGQWDHAIQVLNKSVEYSKHPKHVNYPCTMQTHYFLGCTYLQKYRTLPFDVGPEEERAQLLLQNAWEHMKLIISMKKYGGDLEWFSIEKDEEYLGVTISIIMCLQGRRDEAKQCLQIYFDTVINTNVIEDDDDLYCHCCHQSQGESIKLKKCAGCKVNYYCNRTHQKKEWRGRFIGHSMFCPFLKRWRRVKRQMKKGRRSGDSFELILNHFFYMIEREYSKDNDGSGPREVVLID